MFQPPLPNVYAAWQQVVTGGPAPIGEVLSELLSHYRLSDDTTPAVNEPRKAAFALPALASFQPVAG